MPRLASFCTLPLNCRLYSIQGSDALDYTNRRRSGAGRHLYSRCICASGKTTMRRMKLLHFPFTSRLRNQKTDPLPLGILAVPLFCCNYWALFPAWSRLREPVPSEQNVKKCRLLPGLSTHTAITKVRPKLKSLVSPLAQGLQPCHETRCEFISPVLRDKTQLSKAL